MGKISEITKTEQMPLNIDVFPYLTDHYHDGKIVLPAVEIMNALAVSIKSHLPGAETALIEEVRFDKFLFIPEDARRISAVSELSVHTNGNISAKLMTRNRVKDLPITRIKEHAVLTFSQNGNKEAPRPQCPEMQFFKPSFEVPAQKIYKELVPFGPSYHNLDGSLLMNKNGASGKTRVTKRIAGDDRKAPLGSPFPLDAAFHAACVWGQRYQNIITFPVGIRKREVHHNTRSESPYHIYVVPVGIENDGLIFDIFIADDSGLLYESLSEVLMKDVSAGRMRPPAWIISDEEGGCDAFKKNFNYSYSHMT